MEIVSRKLTDILLLRPKDCGDTSSLGASWSDGDLANVGIATPFVQDNQSRSRRNVLRGLHYQVLHPQGKLIRVLSGSIFDVVVDLRHSSPNFGRHACFELSGEGGLLVWVPPGYAHGFYVTSDQADVFYSVTDYRFAEYERTLLWSDARLAIPWPLGEEPPVLSDKDRVGIPLPEADYYP
jgi:dTDP-4-dehydrorhamnose 3,5-epimerase